MCQMLYIAADIPLPLIPFNDEAPAFNVAKLSRPSELLVRDCFSKPFVVNVGSSTGCGCNFNYGTDFVRPEEDLRVSDDPAEVAEAESISADRRCLVDYLKGILTQTSEVEVFMGWDVEEGDGADHAGTRKLDDLLNPACLEEGQLVTVHL